MARKTTKESPALLAVRAKANAFALEHAHELSSLFGSDVKHDERWITAHPGEMFAWFAHKFGTHLMRVGSGDECLCAVRYRDDGVVIDRGYNADRTGIALSCAAEGYELYMWNGTALVRASSADQLVELYERAILETALAECHREVAAASKFADRRVIDDYTERASKIADALHHISR